MTTATLTFVIAARNAADTIPDTLGSLALQARGDWEAVVIDDGSTDATADVARRARDPRVRVSRLSPRGVATARNAGLALCRTPLVSFLDADDALDPTFASRMVDRIGGFDVAACGFEYAAPDLARSGWTHAPADADHDRDALLECNQFALGAVVFRRDLLKHVSDQHAGRLFTHGTHHEDWDLLLRLAGHAPAWAPVLPDPLHLYRLRPRSRTCDLASLWADGLALIRRHAPDGADPEPTLRRWSLRSLARASLAGDDSLSRTVLDALAPLRADDAGTLTGALRWGLRRARIARDPSCASDAHALRTLLTSRLGGSPVAAAAVERAIASTTNWAAAANSALASLRPGHVLVIFGVGRNGQEALRAVPESAPVGWIDDRHAAALPFPRLRIDDLTPRHTVLVTPDERATILERLRPSGCRVLLPEALPVHADAAAA